jgi:hypothetical protein
MVPLHSPDVMWRIAAKAHSLWKQRGCPHGTLLEDWMAAEEAELNKTP